MRTPGVCHINKIRPQLGLHEYPYDKGRIYDISRTQKHSK